MFNGLLFKHPSADVNFFFDFISDIPSGDSITSQTVTAVDSAGVDASSTIVDSSAVDGTKITARLKAGVNFQDYRVTYTAVMTSSGEDFVKVLDLRVRTNRVG